MKRSGWRFLLLILAAASASCRSKKATDSSSPAPKQELVLTLRMAEEKVKAGHMAIVDVTLTNQTSKILWLNDRLMVNRYSDPPDRREVWFIVNGPRGDAIELECLKNVRPLTSANYRVVKPRESVSVTEILSSCFPIDRPGVYTMVAVYQDGNRQPPPPPAGAEYVSELVQSAPIKFEVLAADAGG